MSSLPTSREQLKTMLQVLQPSIAQCVLFRLLAIVADTARMKAALVSDEALVSAMSTATETYCPFGIPSTATSLVAAVTPFKLPLVPVLCMQIQP